MRYKGYYYDSETQMYYCKSRCYNPDICRWISDDYDVDVKTPIGLNLFVYCNNDSVNYANPSGHFVITLGFLLGSIAIGAVIGGTIAGVSSYL